MAQQGGGYISCGHRIRVGREQDMSNYTIMGNRVGNRLLPYTEWELGIEDMGAELQEVNITIWDLSANVT